MKKILTAFYILVVIFILILIVFFVFIIAGMYIVDNVHNNTFQIQEETPQPKIAIKELDIKALHNRDNELVFSCSAENFIESYNGFWQQGEKDILLSPIDKWQMSEYDKAIHSDHKTLIYNFKEDYQNWTLPSISVYVPENADYVQEITVNFDDHSYRKEMYELYEKMCFYTLKVFFYNLSDEKITELYKTLNQLAYDNVFPHEKAYAYDPTPYALYYKNDVGVYPYFAIGQSVKLCIIPITDKIINEFEKKGVKIYEISEN